MSHEELKQGTRSGRRPAPEGQAEVATQTACDRWLRARMADQAVVVPTHIAVALRTRRRMRRRIVARDERSLKIRTQAQSLGIPVVRNMALARSLINDVGRSAYEFTRPPPPLKVALIDRPNSSKNLYEPVHDSRRAGAERGPPQTWCWPSSGDDHRRPHRPLPSWMLDLGWPSTWPRRFRCWLPRSTPTRAQGGHLPHPLAHHHLVSLCERRPRGGVSEVTPGIRPSANSWCAALRGGCGHHRHPHPGAISGRHQGG